MERFALILDVLPNAVQVADSKGVILYVNKVFVRLTGISQEARVQKNIFDLSPHGAMAQALSNKQSVNDHVTFIGNDITPLVCNAHPLIKDDILLGAVEFIQPIAEHVMALDEMEKIMIQRALGIYGRSMKGKLLVAESLNISLATLYNKIKKYKI
ncbi:PAS domain-containing protein [Peptococcaceae bacterium 1198_IL3148]